MKTINQQLLIEMLDQGYVQMQKHPLHNLYIYNYTAKAQYDKVWNTITLACRGLILDAEYNIIARPFVKFFNLHEPQPYQIPNTTFEVYEKMDGSLGILYWINNVAQIATRGSFTSLQAIQGTQILHRKYASVLPFLNKNKTYLFEIIYPQNRIVLDYGNTEDLILLAIIDTQSGNDEALQDIGFTNVKKYDGIKDVNELQKLEENNKEGFVIKYSNGFRIKVKFTEYIRLHKIITQVSNKTIWEYLMQELPFEEILERVPDEFYDWVKSTKQDLHAQFITIENTCKQNFKVLHTQKETALYFLTCPYSNVLFLMLQNKNYNKAIWKMLQPKYSKPFRIDN